VPTSIWKGHLTFGLVSVPVKLGRAARADKIAFRQVHEATGNRVRQTLFREPQETAPARTTGDDGVNGEEPQLALPATGASRKPSLPFPPNREPWRSAAASRQKDTNTSRAAILF
jgi:hypothetical protein